jgi:hypothetical protein
MTVRYVCKESVFTVSSTARIRHYGIRALQCIFLSVCTDLNARIYTERIQSYLAEVGIS